jgi:hypothetical protein
MNISKLDPNYVSELDYYDGPDIVDGLLAALTRAGLDPDALDIDASRRSTSSTRWVAPRP